MGLPEKGLSLSEGVIVCAPPLSESRDHLRLYGDITKVKAWLSSFDVKDISEDEFESIRVGRLMPWFGREITREINPLEAGLKILTHQKGCFPGQEVVEKIYTRGAPAKRLVALEGEGECPERGTAIHSQADPPVEAGRLTTVVRDGEGWKALGYVKKLFAEPELALKVGRSSAIVKAVSGYK